MQTFKEYMALDKDLTEGTKLTWDDQDDYFTSVYTGKDEDFEIVIRYSNEYNSFSVSMEGEESYDMPIEDDFKSYKDVEKALKKACKGANINLPKEKDIKDIAED